MILCYREPAVGAWWNCRRLLNRLKGLRTRWRWRRGVARRPKMRRRQLATRSHPDFISVGANPKPIVVAVRRSAPPVVLRRRIVARRGFEPEKLRPEPKLLMDVVPFELGIGYGENARVCGS